MWWLLIMIFQIPNKEEKKSGRRERESKYVCVVYIIITQLVDLRQNTYCRVPLIGEQHQHDNVCSIISFSDPSESEKKVVLYFWSLNLPPAASGNSFQVILSTIQGEKIILKNEIICMKTYEICQCDVSLIAVG